jgi:hypothetical protein
MNVSPKAEPRGLSALGRSYAADLREWAASLAAGGDRKAKEGEGAAETARCLGNREGITRSVVRQTGSRRRLADRALIALNGLSCVAYS